MEKIIRLDSIKDYNDFLGLPTSHPLVSVIDASQIEPLPKRLLTTSDHNITEIAYTLGYQYPQYFTRAFKNLMGCTPHEYRATYR